MAGMPRLLLIAGAASHPPGEHEYGAGVRLLARCLEEMNDLDVPVVEDRWPSERSLMDADAIVVFADGGDGHLMVQENHMEKLRRRVHAGMGVGLLHYALEVPAGSGAQVRSWVGGAYEDGYSCNPMWEPVFDTLPDHPITRGVTPFRAYDEWYFTIRLAEGFSADGPTRRDGLTFWPILVAAPPAEVRRGPYVWPEGPYPHVVAAAGRSEVLAWAVERADGGRGFGFTGAHFHANWSIEPFRQLVLNALVWIAGLDVPAGGVRSTLGPGDLERHLDHG
jgi:hypothetical protein